LLIGLGCSSMKAADLANPALSSAEDDWMVSVGAKMMVEPAYPGADTYSAFPFPSIGLRRASDPEHYSALDDTGGIGVSVTPWLRVGAAFDLLDERSKDDDDRLRGLKPVDWTGEAGGFVELWPTDWLRGRIEVLKTFNGADGLVANASLDAIVPVTDTVSVAVGPRLSIADDGFMRTYYGVTPREAARNPRIDRAYKPEAGLESAGVAAAVTYRIDANWVTTVGGGWNRLVGDAAKSPITGNVGSENQFWGGVKVTYTFDVPSRVIPIPKF